MQVNLEVEQNIGVVLELFAFEFMPIVQPLDSEQWRHISGSLTFNKHGP